MDTTENVTEKNSEKQQIVMVNTKRPKNKVKNVEKNATKKGDFPKSLRKGGEKKMSKKDTRKPGEKLTVSRVKRARENAVITQAVGEVLSVMEKDNVSKSDLARTLGVSAPNIHQTLDPKRAMTLRTLARMANALGREVQIRLVAPKAA